MTTNQLTDEDLQAIEQRANVAEDRVKELEGLLDAAHLDRVALLAEVRRLRARVEALSKDVEDLQKDQRHSGALELELSRYKYLETVSPGLMSTAREMAELKRLVEDLRVGKFSR